MNSTQTTLIGVGVAVVLLIAVGAVLVLRARRRGVVTSRARVAAGDAAAVARLENEGGGASPREETP